eukprot:9242238-Pyramimonas_sp.AAC.1
MRSLCGGPPPIFVIAAPIAWDVSRVGRPSYPGYFGPGVTRVRIPEKRTPKLPPRSFRLVFQEV